MLNVARNMYGKTCTNAAAQIFGSTRGGTLNYPTWYIGWDTLNSVWQTSRSVAALQSSEHQHGHLMPTATPAALFFDLFNGYEGVHQ